MNSISQCGLCGNTASDRCAKCSSVVYCSRQCQVDDWPKHKQVCTDVYCTLAKRILGEIHIVYARANSPDEVHIRVYSKDITNNVKGWVRIYVMGSGGSGGSGGGDGDDKNKNTISSNSTTPTFQLIINNKNRIHLSRPSNIAALLSKHPGDPDISLLL
jgi:hypothetical protein